MTLPKTGHVSWEIHRSNDLDVIANAFLKITLCDINMCSTWLIASICVIIVWFGAVNLRLYDTSNGMNELSELAGGHFTTAMTSHMCQVRVPDSGWPLAYLRIFIISTSTNPAKYKSSLLFFNGLIICNCFVTDGFFHYIILITHFV